MIERETPNVVHIPLKNKMASKSIDIAMSGWKMPTDSRLNYGFGSDLDWRLGLPNWPRQNEVLPETNSVVATCINWISDSQSAARLVLMDNSQGGDQNEIVVEHPALERLMNPYPRFSFADYMSAICWDYKKSGNAILFTNRSENQDRVPTLLWFEPWKNVRPIKSENSINVVDHYDIWRGGQKVMEIPLEDSIHFRDGIDPTNRKIGKSRLQAVVQDIQTIDACQNYTVNIVHNGGPIRVFFPDSGLMMPLDEPQMIEIQRRLNRMVHEPGSFHVQNTPGRVEQVSSGPQELALSEIQDRPEANICSALGINPMVIGLAVGSAMRSYANQKEANEQSWVNGILPLNRVIAWTLTTQYLPMFGESLSQGLTFDYDYTDVNALSRFVTEKQDNAIKLFQAGLITREEARTLAGYSSEPEIGEFPEMPKQLQEANGKKDEEEEEKPDAPVDSQVKSILFADFRGDQFIGMKFKRVKVSQKVWRYAV